MKALAVAIHCHNEQECIPYIYDNLNTMSVVVRDKGGYASWREYNHDWNNEHAEDVYLHTNGKIHLLNRFLQENRYPVVWENAVFQILLPSGSGIIPNRSSAF